MAAYIAILPYLQSWKDSKLYVRLLVLPRGNPLDIPTYPSNFAVKIVPGLESLPTLSAVTTQVVSLPVGPKAKEILNALDKEYSPKPQSAPSRPSVTFKKHLPTSYLQASNFAPVRSSFVYTDDSYACAMHQQRSEPIKVSAPSSPVVSWGNIVAFALRQPKLAEELGFIRDVRISLAKLPNGGWIFFTLEQPGSIKVQAFCARIPALSKPCSLFSPVLFKVSDVTPTDNLDDSFDEISKYGDGFAKVVHCAQQKSMGVLVETYDGTHPVNETGIRIGWDDEQVAIWMNRQLTDMPVTMGVKGYRIDVREHGEGSWRSLMFAKGDVVVQNVDIGTFDGELMVDISPAQLMGKNSGDFWLPTYFTNWTGVSLASIDINLALLHGVPSAEVPLHRILGIDPGISLRYGNSYDFRVRLVDGTYGGPTADQTSDNAGVATIKFLRWVPPRQLIVVSKSSDKLQLRRPLLGYPAVLYTGGYNDPIALLLKDVSNSSGREVGIPDPDVDSVCIVVEVTAENNEFYEIYRVIRSFPGELTALLDISVTWDDIPDVAELSVPITGITLPTARDLRISLFGTATKKKYFGTEDAKQGPPVYVFLRKESTSEKMLFSQSTVKALFMQPASSAVARLASQLDLQVNNSTMYTTSESRTVFGCSSKIGHVLGPKSGSITFASDRDLVLQWILVVRFTVLRDWTWSGMRYIVISCNGSEVGSVVLEGKQNGGSEINVIFMDAVSPKPSTGAFPNELNLQYKVVARLLGGLPDRPPILDIHLPVTTVPAQVPTIVSTGIAMSPYTASSDYSTTGERRKFLWVEFDSTTKDQRDKYFARILCNAPDPLLGTNTSENTAEANIAIDPELVRTVVPGQPNDNSGLSAMQELVGDGTHFIVPLPPGLSTDSPELFGFFTYEFRVGHKDMWCTAQGRYGAALIVTGLQHPAPSLYCNVKRDPDYGISVSSQFALPVSEGASVQRHIPKSQIWIMLYVQVRQIDGASYRNVLLGQKEALYTPSEDRSSHIPMVFGTAKFPIKYIDSIMHARGINKSLPLSVLAVELLPNGKHVYDPMAESLGEQRILRTSSLVAVPPRC